jgi:hypothetical protein
VAAAGCGAEGIIPLAEIEAHCGKKRAVLAAAVAVLAEIDPLGQGVRPRDWLAALDERGFPYHPDKPARRAALFNTMISNHIRQRGQRSRIVILGRGRYAVRRDHD